MPKSIVCANFVNACIMVLKREESWALAVSAMYGSRSALLQGLEFGYGSVYCHEFRSHDGASLLASRGVNADGSARRDMFHCGTKSWASFDIRSVRVYPFLGVEPRNPGNEGWWSISLCRDVVIVGVTDGKCMGLLKVMERLKGCVRILP
jgi:hypothetical protein